MKEEIHEFSAKCEMPKGCVPRIISKSPYEYLKLKESRGGKVVPGLVDNMDTRYGEKTTPTTRRTTFNHEERKYY